MTDITESEIDDIVDVINHHDLWSIGKKLEGWKPQILQNQKDAQEYRESKEITNQELSAMQFRQAKTEIYELRQENTKLQSQHKKLVDAIQNRITTKQHFLDSNEEPKEKNYTLHDVISSEISELQNLLKESEK